MSKRAQESTAKEGPAVAKPRLLSAKTIPSARFESASNSPGESNVGSELCFIERTCAKQQPRPNSIFSRAATRCHSIFEQVRSGESESSASTRKQVRCDDRQIERTRLKFHNIQISDHRYLEESLQEPAAKVASRRRGTSTRLEDQHIDLVIIYVDNNESCCSSWTKLQ